MLPFKQIPSGSQIRVPGVSAELDPSHANTAAQPFRALIIGQILGAGIAAPNVPLISGGVADAKLQGGQGSMLAGMTAAYQLNDPFGEKWYLPLADAGGATAATGSIAFTGPSTAAGTISLYIGGNLANYGQPGAISVAITSGESATAIGAAVAAAVNAVPDLPVSANAVTGTVTFTARNKGLVGNDIDIRLNYLGSAGGEALPAGVAAVITAMSGGATNPTLTTALANLPGQSFDFIVSPFTDNTSIAALTAFLNDTAGRWSWETQLYGGVFMAYRGTFSGLTTFGVTMNDQHTSVLGFFDSPSPGYAIAAAVGAQVAVSVRADPTQPITGLQGVVLQGILPPLIQSRFSASLRNTLLFDGISTFRVEGGQVVLEKAITTYQLNTSGQPDNSYLAVETMNQLAFQLRGIRSFLVTTYGKAKLAADGTRAGPTANVVTPSVIRAGIIAWYRGLELNGEAQNSTAFAAALVVQINAQNPNRVDILFTPILMEELEIFALLTQFRLS